MTLLLGGCEGGLKSLIVLDSCSWVKKISPMEIDYDSASDSLLAQILVHNELVVENCE